jgi:hypothetical protein
VSTSKSTPSSGGGVGGVLGNYKSIAHLAGALQQFFLPASLATPPLAQDPTAGNRERLVYASELDSTIGGLPTQAPIEATVGTLVAGTYTWTFSKAFKSPPVVFALAIGTPPNTSYSTSPNVNVPAGIYCSVTPTTGSVTIASTVASDTRSVMLVAVGNPN